jgi:hypothetical protein
MPYNRIYSIVRGCALTLGVQKEMNQKNKFQPTKGQTGIYE